MAGKQSTRRRNGGKDSAVFSVFWEYRPVLLSLIRRRLKRKCDIEDVLQETLTLVLEVERKQKIEHPRSYLFSTAKNLVLRENTKTVARLTEYMEDCGNIDLSTNEPSAFEHVAGRQAVAMLGRAIDSLSPQCRNVFVLRKIHGLRHKEIAERLGLSVSTTEKHLAKALERCDAYMRSAAATVDMNAGRREPRKRFSA